MKPIIRMLLSLVLVASILLAALPVSAARPSAQYVSELHLAEAGSVSQAAKMLTDKGYRVIEHDLNPGGGSVVCLGYKTSSNVEDAITDISVMNMKGGYSITDYNRILELSKTEYKAIAAKYRMIANEFAENYKAGGREAGLAYRQLNYYYIEKGETKTYMGDYMLNFPTDDADFADILLKGNLFVLSNLRALLAMGTSVPGQTIAERVTEVGADSTVYDKVGHLADAKLVYETLANAQNQIDNTNKTIEEIEADTSLTRKEKNDSVDVLFKSIQNIVAFKSIIDAIPYGDRTYGEYLKQEITPEYSAFYPIVEALTPAQRALLGLGQFKEIVLYDSIRQTDENLEKELAAVESEFGEISVYLGTDLEAFNGSFAVTTEALRREAITGESWIDAEDGSFDTDVLTATFLGLGGLTTTVISGLLLKDTIVSIYKSYTTFTPAYADLFDKAQSLESAVSASKRAIEFLAQQAEFAKSKGIMTTDLAIRGAQRTMQSAAENYVNVTELMKSTPMYAPKLTLGPLIGSALGFIAGVVMIGFSVSNFIKIANIYCVEYTDIPINMVDSVSTENGDRFVRYRVVPSFYEENGSVKTRPGDTNGYNGRQWNAIYYTKSSEAGKCLLSDFDLPESEADFGKYTPVHAFGARSVCYDLNKYSKNSSLAKIYLAFRNSNAKKGAETKVPTIVGSILSYGAMAMSAAAGFGLGMGTMALITPKKEKAKKPEA